MRRLPPAGSSSLSPHCWPLPSLRARLIDHSLIHPAMTSGALLCCRALCPGMTPTDLVSAPTCLPLAMPPLLVSRSRERKATMASQGAVPAPPALNGPGYVILPGIPGLLSGQPRSGRPGQATQMCTDFETRDWSYGVPAPSPPTSIASESVSHLENGGDMLSSQGDETNEQGKLQCPAPLSGQERTTAAFTRVHAELGEKGSGQERSFWASHTAWMLTPRVQGLWKGAR